MNRLLRCLRRRPTMTASVSTGPYPAMWCGTRHSIRLWPSAALLAVGLLALAGCGSGPPPRVYVLGAAADATRGVTSEAGLPVMQLKPVSLPDYLDTTDIQLRDGGNELKSSTTGRWGERLSVGIAGALREDLTRRVPGVVVALTEPVQTPTYSLLVNIDAFDIHPDGTCVLAVRWTILGEDNKTILANRKATIIADVRRSSSGTTDEAVVMAMGGAVNQLADHIAVDLSRAIRGATRPR